MGTAMAGDSSRYWDETEFALLIAFAKACEAYLVLLGHKIA